MPCRQTFSVLFIVFLCEFIKEQHLTSTNVIHRLKYAKVRHRYTFIETDIISDIHTLFQEFSQMIHIIKTYNMHPITECPVDEKLSLTFCCSDALFPGPGNRMTNSSSTLLLARHRRTVLNKRKGSLMPGT